MAFGSTNKSGQDQLWYQNPSMSLQPENVRPYTFSQSPSRGGLFIEDTGDLPQQTAGTGNISMDLSSKVSMGGTQNNQKYNFDVQSVNTPFVFNNQNINNYTAIPPAVQDAIYNTTTNNNTTQQFSYFPPSGLSSSVLFVSNVRLTSTNLEYGLRTLTINQGFVSAISSATTYYSVAPISTCP